MQSRREFMKQSSLGMLSLALSGYAQAGEKISKKRPNILFLFTDDHRFSAVNALFDQQVLTPNIDRLVQNGVSFTHAHIMGSMHGAVCMPSRAMLMTGRTLYHLEDGGKSIPEHHAMLPETLRRHGYKTYGIGKWHNGRSSFNRAFQDGDCIFFGGMSDHLKVPVYGYDPSGEYNREDETIGSKFSSELFTDAAVEFLNRDMNSQPFFLYLSYTAPHDPRMAPEEFASQYPPDEILLPENFMPEHPFPNGELKIRDENLAPFPRTEENTREHIAAYYAMISHVDAQIGRVLDALDQSGQAENTIIIFAGDNGLAVGQHGLMGKQNLYEHSIRVPLIISGPGIPQGEKRETLCYLLDLFPTLCEFIDIPTPDSVEGVSFAPVISAEEQFSRDAVFAAYKDFQYMVRTRDDWKLIQYHVNNERYTQLFHLSSDPWELHNLADDPAHADRLKQLNDLLDKWMLQYDLSPLPHEDSDT
ncbi:MAG: sulfatase-like hydrolase/transferase [bacterium]|jgi:arylsulfatase A-like enzyme